MIQFKRTIPAAQWQTINSSPIVLLPTLPSNQFYAIIFCSAVLKKAAGTVAYNFVGADLYLCYDGDTSTGKIGGLTDNWCNTTAETSGLILPDTHVGSSASALGRSVQLKDVVTDATLGDGDVTVSFLYQILTI